MRQVVVVDRYCMSNLFQSNKKSQKIDNFLDYPASKQKQVVERAILGANDMQLALVKEYEAKFGKNRN